MPAECAPAQERSNRSTSRFWTLALPSLSDALFIMLMVLLFIGGMGWSTLLGDGDTATHIRNGDLMLATQSVPVRDPYSFTVPGTQWYAWEWLADILFAWAHRIAGLQAVVLVSGLVICLSMTLLFRHLIWRGAGLPAALFVTILAAGALRIHFLARPHIFTTLFAVLTFWMLDRDWSRPSRSVWWLVPLAVLWVNLHGGFVVLIVSLGLYTLAALLLRDGIRAWRYGLLAAVCSVATLANPYGWSLHLHIWQYLRSDWLLNFVGEFHSPSFRNEETFKFEVLLFLGLAILVPLIRRRRYQEALLIVFWGHAALTSIRHITIFAIAAAAPIAHQLGLLWDHWTLGSARDSIKGALRGLASDLLKPASRTSLWAPAFVLLTVIFGWGQWPVDFPGSIFPTGLVARNASRITGPGNENVRLLSSDLWGGYLNYKLYPGRHVFIDGRSDYFGPKILDEYFRLRAASDDWPQLADRYRFAYALLPRDWPLASAMKRSPDWMLRDQDQRGYLFERLRLGALDSK